MKWPRCASNELVIFTGKKDLSLLVSKLGLTTCVLREAGEIFDAIGKAYSAARCFCYLGEYERAGMTL